MRGTGISTCGCNSPQPLTPENRTRTIIVHFLELDMTRSGVSSCNTCTSVEDQVRQLVTDLQPVLQMVGTAIRVEKTLVKNLDQAKKLQFKASPSIRIEGIEILPAKGDIFGLGERYWEWEGTMYTSPPAAVIVDAVLRSYTNGKFAQDPAPATFQVPDSLQEYFTDSSDKPTNGSCGCS